MKPAEFKKIILKEAKKNRPDLPKDFTEAIINGMMVFIKTEDDVKNAIKMMNKKAAKKKKP